MIVNFKAKLEEITNLHEEIQAKLSDSNISADNRIKLSKQFSALEQILLCKDDIEKSEQELSDSKNLLTDNSDEELLELAKQDVRRINQNLETLYNKLKMLLIPKDIDDEKNAILEIRAGTGGDEAALFSMVLMKMYQKYAELKKWKFEIMSFSETNIGGCKEAIISFTGTDVFSQLKYESGVHRVQRVPQTETQGRVHTSAATVMVLPEAEEFDVEINMSEVRVDYFCSSGPGGQSVNTTYSAVRLTHEPTGVVAQCQDQKSQHKNKEKAMKVLRSRLYEIELNKRMESDSQKRNELVNSGDRSAKIRTYNYPQGRVTDHRIGLTLYDLPKILDGDVSKLIDEIQLFINTEKLKEAGEV